MTPRGQLCDDIHPGQACNYGLRTFTECTYHTCIAEQNIVDSYSVSYNFAKGGINKLLSPPNIFSRLGSGAGKKRGPRGKVILAKEGSTTRNVTLQCALGSSLSMNCEPKYLTR